MMPRNNGEGLRMMEADGWADRRKAVSGSVPAYLTVYVSLTLLVMLSLCLVLIDGARRNTIRVESEYILDIGLNSIFAEYHRELLEQYNLFYIDTSYGSNYPSYYNTEARLRKYLEKNITIEDKNIFSSLYMDLLAIEFPEVEITGARVATDHGGYYFQKQAIEAVKDDIGITAAETVLEWLTAVEEEHLLDNTIDEEMNSIEENLKEYQGKKQLEDNTWVDVEVKNPVAEVAAVDEGLLLSMVLSDQKQISSKAVAADQYISSRRKTGSINEGNVGEGGSLTILERLMFHEYLIKYAGNYMESKTDSALDYQLEYLLFGKGQDVENLKSTAWAICGLRETANLVYLLSSAEKKELITTVSTALSAALLVPEAEPLFEAVILLGWATIASIQDVKALLHGERVPLLKDDTTWKSDLNSVFSLDTGDAGSEEEGLRYTDYLRLLLYFSDLEVITFRFMDLIEMDIRQTAGNENFRIDGCIDYVEAAVEVRSGYDYECAVQRIKGY